MNVCTFHNKAQHMNRRLRKHSLEKFKQVHWILLKFMSSERSYTRYMT